jgi:imidazolonepropionase-like amidohydrolase
VKVISDWPGAPGGGALPALHEGRLNYTVEALREAVTSAHAAGARLAVHAMTKPAVAQAVEAAVDCIEHATEADADLIDAMARRGIAWTPTVASFQATHRSAQRRGQTDLEAWLTACFDQLKTLIPRARARGVVVLAGTDILPPGSVAREVAALHAFGLSPVDALATASTAARAYLGAPGIQEGAPADLVFYEQDPRTDPEVLSSPCLVMIGGRAVSPAPLA